MIEEKLLSKMIDEKQFYIVYKYGVDLMDFETHSDVFEFIKNYVKSENCTPDYRTIVAKFQDFEYMPEIGDSFKFLCKQLKARTAKRLSFELLQHRATKAFKEMDGDDFVKWLAAESARVEKLTTTDYEAGSNYATNGKERLAMYEEAKDPNSHVIIPTPFKALNDTLGGGWELGEYLLLLAFTNVGKSWYASHIGLHTWKKGFGVLHYSPELNEKQQLFRLDTLAGCFDNQKLRRGKLDTLQEEKFKKFLQKFNHDDHKIPYIVKTMEDLPHGLSIDVIEADLQANTDIRFVIIDGFNLMIHEKADGTRNKMTATSRRLRQLFGRYNVTGLVVHQTSTQSEKEKKRQMDDDEEIRVIKPPELTDFSETSAVIQDASFVMTLDAFDGMAQLATRKAREPDAIGKIIEFIADFNNGVIREQNETRYF